MHVQEIVYGDISKWKFQMELSLWIVQKRIDQGVMGRCYKKEETVLGNGIVGVAGRETDRQTYRDQYQH